MDSRGESEVVGFVLVFSMISLSIGAVFVGGFDSLQSTRDAEQLSNVERAFDVLADNVDDIVRNDAPSRATEFKLYGGGLHIGEDTTFTVTIPDAGSPPPSVSVQTAPLVYDSGGSATTIRFVNGAVLREEREGALFLEEPRFLFRVDPSTGDRTAVIPLVETRSSGGSNVGGAGAVQIRADHVLSEVLAGRTAPIADTGDGDYDVVLTIRTTDARAALWEDFLDGELEAAYGTSDPCSRSGGTVTCTFEVQRLYVTVTRIDVSLLP